MIPTTVQQVVIVLLLLLPGFFYEGARERLQGPTPGALEFGRRIVRSIAASVVLDAIYVVAIGPWLVTTFISPHGREPVGLSGVIIRPRQAAATALVTIVLIPALVALAEYRLAHRGRHARFTDAPTAWDGLFRDLPECLIRVRLKSGIWVGGWYSTSSWAASYPNANDLYLEKQYSMSSVGLFGAPLDGSGGVYISGADIEVLEIINPGQSDEEDGDNVRAI